MVVGRVGELVDALLRHLLPVGVAEMPAGRLLEVGHRDRVLRRHCSLQRRVWGLTPYTRRLRRRLSPGFLGSAVPSGRPVRALALALAEAVVRQPPFVCLGPLALQSRLRAMPLGLGLRQACAMLGALGLAYLELGVPAARAR